MRGVMGEPTPDDCPTTPPDRRAPNDLAIVSLVLSQMTLMESRLRGAIEKSDASATRRWLDHEAEHARIEKTLLGFNDHLSAEDREALVFNTRLQPLRSTASLVRREWRTLTIVAFIVVDFLGQILDRAHLLFP
jgi:ferric-dicitrate binding protein FerR (iron transport regulator)